MVNEIYGVWTIRKLKAIVGKSMVIVFERREVKGVDFNTPYRVSVPPIGRCEVVLGEKMEEVKEFTYLGTVLCKQGEMEGKIRDVKGRCVIGSLARVMRGSTVSMKIKRGLRNSILLPTLIYGD